MAFEAELDGLARRLSPRGDRARAVMLVPISPAAGSSKVAQGLAQASHHLTGRPVWLYDLDFAHNRQASSVRLNGEAFAGELSGQRFWRAEPDGMGRLALRRRIDAPIYVSRFERPPGSVRRLVFHPNGEYWQLARELCGLVVVDAPHGSAAVASLAGDMDGVVLVANSVRDGRSAAETLADQIEDAGGRVLGVVLNSATDAR
jgi:Mrp family chromosome partitioning ATPase